MEIGAITLGEISPIFMVEKQVGNNFYGNLFFEQDSEHFLIQATDLDDLKHQLQLYISFLLENDLIDFNDLTEVW